MCGRFIRKGESKKVAEFFGGKDGEEKTSEAASLQDLFS